MQIYKFGVCSHISWDLTTTSFPLSWVESSLDPLATKYLKSWLGLARPADPSQLFLPPSHGGLRLSSISGLYRKLQVGKAALLMTSRDRAVQFVSRSALEKESCSLVLKFKPATIVQEMFVEDPGASYKSLATRSKKSVKIDELEQRLAHAASLKVQREAIWDCGGTSSSNLAISPHEVCRSRHPTTQCEPGHGGISFQMVASSVRTPSLFFIC